MPLFCWAGYSIMSSIEWDEVECFAGARLRSVLWLWWSHDADDRKLTGLGWCGLGNCLEREEREKSLGYNYSQSMRCNVKESFKIQNIWFNICCKVIPRIHLYWFNSDNNCANEVLRYPTGCYYVWSCSHHQSTLKDKTWFLSFRISILGTYTGSVIQDNEPISHKMKPGWLVE